MFSSTVYPSSRKAQVSALAVAAAGAGILLLKSRKPKQA